MFHRLLLSIRNSATRVVAIETIARTEICGLPEVAFVCAAGLKAPAIVQPKGLPPEKVRNEMGAKIVAMDAVIAQCESRFGPRGHVLDHPVLGPLMAP